MNNSLKPKLLSAVVTSAVLAGCATQDDNSVSAYSPQELERRYENLATREATLAKREAELSDLALARQNSSPVSPGINDSLLPPQGRPGECYARVWVEPTYKTITDRVVVKEASTRVEIEPAEYGNVDITELVAEESYRLETIPATYETVTEERLISEGSQIWKLDLKPNSAPASQALLDTAANYGIDLAAAKPNQCFHEHYVPAKFEDVQEAVLVKEAYDVIETQEAEYRWVEKQVLVSEASSRLIEVPAEYTTVTEEVIDVPAHTVWKKGTGPIQKIDAATGEIMCLVEVPATYKTVSRRVLSSPATTREEIIPAKYETIKVRELVSAASEARKTVPAEYKNITLSKQVADSGLFWHEVHDKTMSRDTRTGNKICLTEEAPVYETISKTVVKTPASTRKVVIPAKYETISVRKVVKQAQERIIDIPAEYDTVSRQEVATDGKMEWRSILCETNINADIVSQIQQALDSRDYKPGPIDGVIGQQTISAMNSFQRDNDLPVDAYLNIETIEALGVSI